MLVRTRLKNDIFSDTDRECLPWTKPQNSDIYVLLLEAFKRYHKSRKAMEKRVANEQHEKHIYAFIEAILMEKGQDARKRVYVQKFIKELDLA